MSGDNDSNVHFKELNKEEKISKISQLCSANNSLATIWKKGSSQKNKIELIRFYPEQDEILVDGLLSDDLIGQELLYSFEINGLNFFGKCSLSSPANKRKYLNISQTLFKSERRVNFRLLTYPHQKVFLHFPVPFEKDEEGNVVSMSTGVSETGLFENFLEVIKESSEENEIENHIKIRVLDISVTGAALLLSAHEDKLFQDLNVNLGNVILDFNGELIDIPDCEILYKLDFNGQGNSKINQKAGLRFLNIDTNLDEKLAATINKTLRSIESEFEDFLK